MRHRIACCLIALAGIVALPVVNFAVPKPPSAVAAAAKNLADARAKLAKVKAELDPIKRRLAVNFEGKPEWKSTKDALTDAKAKYESAAKRVVATLEKDPAYKEQLAKRAKAQATVDSGAKGVVPSSDDNAPKLTDEDVGKAQQDRIDSAIMLKKMEHDANENDAAFVAARQKLKESQDAWDALESQLDDAVKLDPAYPPMKTDIEQAEAAVKTAQDQYEAAVKAQAGQHTARPAPKKF